MADNDQKQEDTDLQKLETQLSDSNISSNTIEDNTDVTERKITQTDHLNKRLLDAFLQKINETGAPASGDSGELDEKINGEHQDFNDNPEKASNSGKTTLTSKLVKHFGPKIIHGVSQDFYFYDSGDKHHVKVPELGVENYEVITALDMDRMVQDVKAMKEKYQRQPGNNINIILIEGFTIYEYKPLNDMFDIKYFLTISEDNCRERRSHRHYIPADIPGYFDIAVWPAYTQYLQLVKSQKDIVYLDGDNNQEIAFQRVSSDLENLYSTSLDHLK